MDNSPEGFGYIDSLDYMLLGKSISLGEGYRQIWACGGAPYTPHPFLFPLILSPVIAVFGFNFLAMKIPVLVAAIGTLWLTYLFFRRASGPRTALAILALTAFSAQFIFFSQKIMTEIPYLFFSLLAIIFIERAKEEEMRRIWTIIFAGAFILAAFFTRVFGAMLAAGALAYLFFERNRDGDMRAYFKRLALLALFLGVPILLWIVRNYYIRGNAIETFQFFMMEDLRFAKKFSFFEKTARCVYAYVFYAYPKILTGIQFASRSLWAFALTAITFYGFFIRFFKKRGVVEYYVMFYMAIMFTYANSMICGTRYVVPLMPFIFYYFVEGSRGLLKYTPSWKGGLLNRVLPVFVVTGLIFSNVKAAAPFFIDRDTLRESSAKERKNFLAMAEWAKANTPRDSVFSGAACNSIYFYFDRKTQTFPPAKDAVSIIDGFYKKKIDYVVVSPAFSGIREYMIRMMAGRPADFFRVYQRRGNIIYKVVK